MGKSSRSRNLRVEALESRLALSLSFGLEAGAGSPSGLAPEADVLAVAEAKGGAGGGGSPAAPPIRLDLVALHEFGHSLGLDHSSDPGSIMYAYYNANYNLANFTNDSAVATLQSLYSNVTVSRWKDSLDPTPGNGAVDVTYSFMPDGTRMDKGSSDLFATFDRKFGQNQWQSVFTDQLDRWADVSDGRLQFVSHADSGLPFNYSGAAQNDSNAGDIRIGAHRFDGAGKVLAHAYFPPPNGATAAGDAHFDDSENWVLGGSSASTSLSAGSAFAASFSPGGGNLVQADASADSDQSLGLLAPETESASATTVIATEEGHAVFSAQASNKGNTVAVASADSRFLDNLASERSEFIDHQASDQLFELLEVNAELALDLAL